MAEPLGAGRSIDRSLAILAALSLVAETTVGLLLPVLPLYAQSLGATPVLLAAMVSVSAIASAGGQLVGGTLSARIHPRRLVPAGLVAYGLSSVLSLATGSAVVVAGLRALSGLGSGLYIVGERLYVRNVVDRARLAFANSILHAAAAVGLIVGPVVGGIYADLSDLGAPFVLAAVLCAVVAALALVVLPARLHPRSAVAAAAGVATAPPADVAAVADLSPALPADATAPRWIDRRALGILVAANVPFVAGYGSFVTTFVPFANEGLHWSTVQIGLAFSLFALGNVVGAPILGAAADRLGRTRVAAISAIPIVAFAASLVVSAPDGVLLALAFIAGAGVAGYTSSWFALVGIATGGVQGGTTFGAILAVTSLGTVLGALLAGQVWDLIGIRAAMVVTVVAFTAAGVLILAHREPRAAPGPPSNSRT